LRLRANDGIPVVCLATAHPAKFPNVIAKALELKEGSPLPEAAVHPDLVQVPDNEANLSICVLDNLEHYLAAAIGSVGNNTMGKAK
jgi:threonine synthase